MYTLSTSPLERRELLPSRQGLFTLGKKSPHYPLSRKMGGSHGPSQQFGEEKNTLLLPGIEKQFRGRPEPGLANTS